MSAFLNTITEIVVAAARQEILPRYKHVQRQHKPDGSIITEADLAMQKTISARIQQHWPDHVILSEEMTPQEQLRALHSKQPLWCLDPLDGTSNFAAGIPYFAVSIALIENNHVSLGVVYDPVRDECFAATSKQSTTLNGQPLVTMACPPAIKQSTAIVDFKRLTEDLAIRIVRERPFASQRNFGASALDWCWIAAGRGHLYLHGSQNLWDYAAGHLILQQAGGYSLTLENEPVFKFTLDKRSAIAAMDKPLLADWVAWINGLH